MSPLTTACIFLFIYAVAARDPDLADHKNFNLTEIKPGDEFSKGNTLEVALDYDVFQTLETVINIWITISEVGRVGGYYDIAQINSSGITGSMVASDAIQIDGKLGVGSDTHSNLNIVWDNEDDGYCRTYIGAVRRLRPNGNKYLIKRTIDVGPREGYTCVNGREVANSIEIPEYVKDAFPGATQKEQEEIVEKLNSIDNNTYDVSDIYDGRVYIATISDTNFELHKMNELCKTAGGYLVEMDSPEEQYFVRDFLKSLGSYRYYTGANDVDNEGNFVYYNSKKPVTNVVWKEGEPNNGGGNESCVEILKKGLNDNKCTRDRGYICEIPLVVRTPPPL